MQMFQAYVSEKECRCPTSLKKPDCECFTLYNRRVPLRISNTDLIHARLWFGNNTPEARNLDTNLRLREARLYLKQSSDIVVLRYEKLWQKLSVKLAKEADDEIIKMANRLELEVVPTEPTLTQQTRRLMVDDDDDYDTPRSMSYSYGAQDASGDNQQYQPYNVQENSIKRQLSNFISQTEAHFQERYLKTSIQPKLSDFFNIARKGIRKGTEYTNRA